MHSDLRNFFFCLYLKFRICIDLNLRAPSSHAHVWHVYVLKSRGQNPCARQALQTSFVRPVLQLICCFTFAAPELRLTVLAHQAGLLPSRRVVQRVLVELEAAEWLHALVAGERRQVSRVEAHCAAGLADQ